MKLGTTFLTAIISLWCCAPVYAEDVASASFISTLTTPVSISSFGINPEHYSGLTKEQRRAVLSAKQTLCSFFRALETQEKDVNSFLAPELLSSKLTREKLRRSLVSDETSIVQLGISDILPNGDDHLLNLEFYVVTISEGSFNTGKGIATMRKTSNGWKVSAIKINP